MSQEGGCRGTHPWAVMPSTKLITQIKYFLPGTVSALRK